MSGEKSISSKDGIIVEKKDVHWGNYELLTNTDQLRSILVEMKPGEALDGRKLHAGEEFKYVIKGEIEFSVGEKTYRLGPGEWLWHASTEPHGARNPGQEVAKYMTIVAR